MNDNIMSAFAYLHGEPQGFAQLRTHKSDFKVYEILPFEPCGEGEHLFIYLRKTGVNTIFVAKALAQYFNVKESLVSYAGLKDRFAVTEQWFGVHLPGKQTFNLSGIVIDGVEILHYKRHNKKLRIGALLGNRFELILRNISDENDITKRWHKIQQSGVPNYFGEQRFGIEGGNLPKALALFAGKKIRDKKKRGLYLSAARSFLFNHIVNARIEQNVFSTLLTGDVCMLAGTQSVFKVPAPSADLEDRLKHFDIDITAAMWGAGQLMTSGKALTLEQNIAEQHQQICDGLADFGLKQERRKIRLAITQGKLAITNDIAQLSFFLPAGCYATTVLRELVNYQDMTERA
jgi:tRNA pseudouridine13 synthase